MTAAHVACEPDPVLLLFMTRSCTFCDCRRVNRPSSERHAEVLTCTLQVPALPATLHELTLHEWGAEQPLQVAFLTRLQRLTLFGSAYRALDVPRTPALSPGSTAPAPPMLLPASLRVLDLRECFDVADALHALGHPQLRPPPGASLSLHTDNMRRLQWPVYMDASLQPRLDEGVHGARLPAGFAALQLCIPRIIVALYEPASAPQAPRNAPELLCRLFAAAPDSYSHFRVLMPAAGGLIVGGVSREIVRSAAYCQPPAVRGHVAEHFEDAEALAKRARWCVRRRGLRASTVTIDGDVCLAVYRTNV